VFKLKKSLGRCLSGFKGDTLYWQALDKAVHSRAFEPVPQADQRQVAGSVGSPFCLQFLQVAGYMAGSNFVENQKYEDS
jgi:hypothetical protein